MNVQIYVGWPFDVGHLIILSCLDDSLSCPDDLASSRLDGILKELLLLDISPLGFSKYYESLYFNEISL